VGALTAAAWGAIAAFSLAVGAWLAFRPRPVPPSRVGMVMVPEADGGYIEAFAAGAVLTMLADSMIPEAYQQGGKLTGLLAVLGFAVAGALSALE
jgi:hypothetical protein